MKNIILIFLFAFIGICYAAPPDVALIPKDKYAICVNVFEPVYSPVAVEAQNFEICHIEKQLCLPSNIGYLFYEFGFKEKYLPVTLFSRKGNYKKHHFVWANSKLILQKTCKG